MPPHEEPRYTIRSQLFEFGLIRGPFDYHTISLDVIFLLTSLASAFHESGHPTMKYMSVPPPHKWEFYEQEFITCLGTPFEE